MVDLARDRVTATLRLTGQLTTPKFRVSGDLQLRGVGRRVNKRRRREQKIQVTADERHILHEMLELIQIANVRVSDEGRQQDEDREC